MPVFPNRSRRWQGVDGRPTREVCPDRIASSAPGRGKVSACRYRNYLPANMAQRLRETRRDADDSEESSLEASAGNLRYLSAWLTVGWFLVGVVVYFSLTRSPPGIEALPNDKVGHLIAYLVLTFWFVQIYRGWPRIAYAAGFVLLGIALEVIQGQTTYRTFEIYDVIANTLGVVVGLGFGLTPASRTLIWCERQFRGPDGDAKRGPS